MAIPPNPNGTAKIAWSLFISTFGETHTKVMKAPSIITDVLMASISIPNAIKIAKSLSAISQNVSLPTGIIGHVAFTAKNSEA